jgi:hypothetical protein
MGRLRGGWVVPLLVAAGGIVLWRATAGAGRDFAWEQTSGPWIDEGRLLQVHRKHAREVGQKAGACFRRAWACNLEHLLWPDDATLATGRVPAERTAKARAACVRELGWVLKPAYVPPGLAEHLIAVSGYGRNASDFLFGRYRVNDHRIQVIHSGHDTGILIVPRRPPAKPQASRDYAMQVIRDLFVPMRPEDEPRMRGGQGDLGGLVHGGYMNPYRNAEDALTGPSPWYSGSFITDGAYVFVSSAKWGLREGVDIRFRAAGPEYPPQDQPILLFEPASSTQ